VPEGCVKTWPPLLQQDRDAVMAVFDSNVLHGNNAPQCTKLQEEWAAFCGAKYCIVVNSGTAALHAAVAGVGVEAGDEVIVPAFTVFSTPAAALQCTAVPIVADVDAETWTLDVKDVERKITPRTRAIIPVSICGLMPDMDPLMELARKHDLIVIEDNAQGYLCEYKGRVAGSIGHFASFSFQASKTVTCGDGGILICSDPDLALEARRAATIGFRDLTINPGDNVVDEELRCHPNYRRHSWLGWNQRLPEIACAVALAELERVEELVEMRCFAAEAFAEVVDNCDWLTPQVVPGHCTHTYWTYPVKIERDDIDWAEFRRSFTALGGDGFYGAYCPAHLEEVFENLSHAIRDNPARYPHWADGWPDYAPGLCPVWEGIQPRIAMFKTNYFDAASAREQASILKRTVRRFS